ncbi:MAG: ionic transporter y4hA [Burkholderiaceae bacterium]|nr:ionic transporter y4hA [Burkholderiaceae bacterium]
MAKLTYLIPVASLGVLAAGLALPLSGLLVAFAALFLVGTVFSAVHHAEVVAARVGEPFGTLVLALAVTVIEASLILSMMLAGGEDKATLPRDTIYAAVMVICTGVIGICLLVGGLRHREQSFRIEGSGSGIAALIALATLSLVMPDFTTSASGGSYTPTQLAFVGVASLLLWGVFVFVQTVRHRDYFLPTLNAQDEDAHAPPPSVAVAWWSFATLLVALIGVVGLAKVLSPAIENAVDAIGAPAAVVGIVIAMIVLMPETWAALRAARMDRLQTSINLAIGSALATIGLTIPVVVAAVLIMDLPLELGLEPKDITLLALTFLVTVVTLGSGKTNMMQGAIHLVLFAAFLFLSFVP